MTCFDNDFLSVQLIFKFHIGKNIIRIVDIQMSQYQIVAGRLFTGIAFTFMQFKFSEVAENATTNGTFKGSAEYETSISQLMESALILYLHCIG